MEYCPECIAQSKLDYPDLECKACGKLYPRPEEPTEPIDGIFD